MVSGMDGNPTMSSARILIVESDEPAGTPFGAQKYLNLDLVQEGNQKPLSCRDRADPVFHRRDNLFLKKVVDA